MRPAGSATIAWVRALGGQGAVEETNDVPDKAKEPVAEGGRGVTRGRRLTEN